MDQYNQLLSIWRSYDISTVSRLESHLDSFPISFAYHSARIKSKETTYRDTREIFETGSVTSFTGDPHVLTEQQNQKLCYEYLNRKIAQKSPLSLELVREVQFILTSGTYSEELFIHKEERPGQFKKHDYLTILLEIGTVPKDVEAELGGLLDEINSFSDGDVLVAASYFHARFALIQPFALGNGRTGRALLNYILMGGAHPPLTVHEEDRAHYYNGLRCYYEAEDLNTLLDFLRGQTVKTWSQLIQESTVSKNTKSLSDFTR